MAFDALVTDTRLSIQRLRRSPVSSAVIVATLTLSLWANITVFSLLNSMSLRRISADNPGALVGISAINPKTDRPGYIYSEAFEVFRRQQQSFSAVAMYTGSLFRVQARGVSADVVGEAVTTAFFELAGARLLAGHFFAADLSGASGEQVLISERLWHRSFASDAHAVGETFNIEAVPVTVAGVIRADFLGMLVDTGADVWVPISLLARLRGEPDSPVRATHIVARLRPNVPLDRGRAEVLARWGGIQAAASSGLAPMVRTAVQSQRVAVESLATGISNVRTQYESSLKVLVGLGAILLLVGVVNLGAMTAARIQSRQHEIAVRVALGVGQGRLLMQFVLDGLVLAVCALAVAIPMAWWSSEVVTAAVSYARTIPQRPMTPDARVLEFATALALALGTAIALPSAWLALAGQHLHISRGTVVPSHGRLKRFGLVVQVALSMVLLIGAGLYYRT